MNFKPLRVLKDYGGTRITLGRDFQTGLYLVEKRVVTGDKFVAKLLENEIRIYQKVKHRNIVKFFGRGKSPLSFIIEYAPYGTLREYLKFNREKEVIEIFISQIINVIYYLHNLGIIHNDINDTNFLVFEKNKCKLSDFAMSGEIGKPIFKDKPAGFRIGTEGFSLSRDIEISLVKNDIYSLGKLFYTMLTGRSVLDSLDLSDIDSPFSEVITNCLTNKYKSVNEIKEHLGF